MISWFSRFEFWHTEWDTSHTYLGNHNNVLHLYIVIKNKTTSFGICWRLVEIKPDSHLLAGILSPHFFMKFLKFLLKNGDNMHFLELKKWLSLKTFTKYEA